MELEQMLNEVLDQLREISLIFATISLVFGAIQCFFGYKIFRFWIALIGFFVFGGLGYAIGYASADGNKSMAVIIALVFACLGAFLAYKLYAIGVFIQCSVTAFIMVILLNALNGDLSNGIITLAAIVGVVVGIIGVLLIKHMIIITTSFSGGLAVGNSLAIILSVEPVIGTIIGLIVSILGLIVQYKMNSDNKATSHVNVEPFPVQQNVTYMPNSYNETVKEVAVSNPAPVQQEVSNPAPIQQEVSNPAPIQQVVSNSEPVQKEVVISTPVQQVVTNHEPAPKETINPSTIYCSKCGAANKTTSKFCTSCGNKLANFN